MENHPHLPPSGWLRIESTWNCFYMMFAELDSCSQTVINSFQVVKESLLVFHFTQQCLIYLGPSPTFSVWAYLQVSEAVYVLQKNHLCKLMSVGIHFSGRGDNGFHFFQRLATLKSLLIYMLFCQCKHRKEYIRVITNVEVVIFYLFIFFQRQGFFV